mgnify:FL=1
MEVEIGRILVAIVGGSLVEVFFQLVKYKGSPANYLSVRQFISHKYRKHLSYSLFRVIPVIIMVLLVVSIEQHYFKVKKPCIYALISTGVSLLFRDVWGLFFKKKKFFIERMIHIVNILLVVISGVLIGLAGDIWDLSHFAPSNINNLFDNIWSSMAVAMLVLGYFNVTNMGESYNTAEDDNNRALIDYATRKFYEIHDNYHELIDQFCESKSCNKLLLYGILIYEDMNRPRVIRKIENAIVTFFKCELTVGIAQVKSKKPLTDTESIKLAAGILKNTRNCNTYNVAEVSKAVEAYNSGEAYPQNIIEIMNIIRCRVD